MQGINDHREFWRKMLLQQQKRSKKVKKGQLMCLCQASAHHSNWFSIRIFEWESKT
jgi:hypothetical protein